MASQLQHRYPNQCDTGPVNASGTNSCSKSQYEALVLLTNTRISVITVAQTAEFGSGPIAGQIIQVQVIPESSTYALLNLALAAEFAFRPANQTGDLFVKIFETRVDFIAKLISLHRNLFPLNRAPLVKTRRSNQPRCD